LLFSILDLSALGFFLATWAIYSLIQSRNERRQTGLNARMNPHRAGWATQLLGRDNRIVDAQIVAALQNGTAFFASTALIAAGGALTILRSTREFLDVIDALPFSTGTTTVQWEIKTIGLTVIFVYAFFKFAWSYRLFNYVAIMIGATPPSATKGEPQAQAHAAMVARLCEAAGRHFNRGQRAFFFALGYLGWFIGPWVLIATSIAVAIVLLRRQLGPEANRILGDRLT